MPYKKGLSGFALKRIAILSMLIDHFGSIVMDGVLAPYAVDGAITFTGEMPFFIRNAYVVKGVCEALGSVAFPLFCFLLVEGFLHTKSRPRYALRLGLFAILSEVPYDLAHYGVLFDPRLQNVLFTLLVGFATLCAIAAAQRRFAERTAPRWTFTLLAAAAGMGVSFLLRSEYVFLGIAAITLLYLLRAHPWLRLLGLCPLLVASPWVALAAAPIALYNGERGRGSQYFFYVFYPAHFLVLTAIARLLESR